VKGDVTAGKNIIQWTRKGVVARNQEWVFKGIYHKEEFLWTASIWCKTTNVAAILTTYSLYSDGFICPVSNERLALDVEVIDQMWDTVTARLAYQLN
jgi:hypothetical protein